MQVITGSRKAPHPKYFVGEGQAVEFRDAVKQPAHLLCCLIMRCLRLRNITWKLSAKYRVMNHTGFRSWIFWSACAYPG
ncbi:hypothetical protein ACNKHS_25610 [Shigella flexneri]